MIFQITDNSTGGWILFVLSVLVSFAISVFVTNLGVKMQMVSKKNKRYIILISGMVGLVTQIFLIVFQTKLSTGLAGQTILDMTEYLNNAIPNIGISIGVSVVANQILKILASGRILVEGFEDITKLEKGSSLLNVENLKIYYPLLAGMIKREIASVKAVDGITFKINAGETLGLVGESGCGKTTVAKAILGLVDINEGEIQFRDEVIPHEYSKYLRQKIQIVYQDPDASLNPRKKIVDIISEPLKCLMGITSKEDVRKRVLKLLEMVSLKREHLDRYPHEFSGGQKQRIIIARALACNPVLIILDEPTSALDVSVQAQILNLLKNLQKKYKYGFLFITHNLAVANHISDRIAVMYLGRFVEIGTTDQIFFDPKHPYTKALLESRSEIDPYDQEIKFVIKGEIPSPIFPPIGCHFNPRCPSESRSKKCFSQYPEKIEIDKGHFVWCYEID